MFDNIVSSFQIFGIGWSFGLAGPCFFACAPILVTFIAGKQSTLRQSLKDIFIFLTGRLFAYLILGYLAAASGAMLREFISSDLAAFFRLAGAVIIVVLGFVVLTGRDPASHICRFINNKALNLGGIFSLGFIIGISPCAPLLALLFEIALISKKALDGIIYALFFGLGTFISGIFVLGVLSGISGGLAARILKSKRGNLIFRIICAFLLWFFGLSAIIRGIT